MNMREIRLSKGLTQKELAELIGKDRSLISKYETTNILPPVPTAKALGKVLEVDWTIFYNGVGEESSRKQEAV